MTRPSTSSESLGWRLTTVESANVGSRNVVDHVVDVRDLQRAADDRASTASDAIAIFIGSARSAMWCSGPGKPTSVSSSSPFAGLSRLAAWWRWPCSSSRASAHGSP